MFFWRVVAINLFPFYLFSTDVVHCYINAQYSKALKNIYQIVICLFFVFSELDECYIGWIGFNYVRTIRFNLSYTSQAVLIFYHSYTAEKGEEGLHNVFIRRQQQVVLESTRPQSYNMIPAEIYDLGEWWGVLLRGTSASMQRLGLLTWNPHY